jgi:hypothetical protein
MKSLSESATAGNIGSELMEDLARTSGPGLKDVLLEIRYPKGPGSGARRLQRLNPTEIQQANGEIPVRYLPKLRPDQKRYRQARDMELQNVLQ